MPRMTFALAALTLPVMFASASEAATFTASVFNGTCGFVVTNGDVGAEIACGTARASANPGSLSVAVEAFYTSTSSGISSASDVRASAQVGDVIFFSGMETGWISIPLDFAGSISVFASIPSGVGFGGGTGGASAAVGSDVLFSVSRSFSILGGASATGVLSEIRSVDIPIVNGMSVVNASIGAQASCSLVLAGGDFGQCSALVDYGASLRFLGASVFDSLGNRRDDVIVTSQSGFDYRRGVDPHAPPPAPIPLPASALLLLSSLLGLAIARQIPGVRK